MKKILLMLLLISATAAFGQSFATVLNNQPQIFEIPSHEQHASFRSLATPQSILESSSLNFAQGVKPLWECPLNSETVSLGETARLLRKEHDLARKAERVITNQ